MGQFLGVGAVPFGVELGPHVTQCCPADAYHRTKWHLDPSSRLATTNMGRKLGGAVLPFWGGKLDPHPAQCGLGRSLALPLLRRGSWVPIKHNVAWAEAYIPTKWHLDPCSHFVTTDMGRKLGGCANFGERKRGPI